MIEDLHTMLAYILENETASPESELWYTWIILAVVVLGSIGLILALGRKPPKTEVNIDSLNPNINIEDSVLQRSRVTNPIFCPNCGSIVMPDQKFCSECGESLQNRRKNIRCFLKTLYYFPMHLQKEFKLLVYISQLKEEIDSIKESKETKWTAPQKVDR